MKKRWKEWIRKRKKNEIIVTNSKKKKDEWITERKNEGRKEIKEGKRKTGRMWERKIEWILKKENSSNGMILTNWKEEVSNKWKKELYHKGNYLD